MRGRSSGARSGSTIACGAGNPHAPRRRDCSVDRADMSSTVAVDGVTTTLEIPGPNRVREILCTNSHRFRMQWALLVMRCGATRQQGMPVQSSPERRRQEGQCLPVRALETWLPSLTRLRQRRNYSADFVHLRGGEPGKGSCTMPVRAVERHCAKDVGPMEPDFVTLTIVPTPTKGSSVSKYRRAAAGSAQQGQHGSRDLVVAAGVASLSRHPHARRGFVSLQEPAGGLGHEQCSGVPPWYPADEPRFSEDGHPLVKRRQRHVRAHILERGRGHGGVRADEGGTVRLRRRHGEPATVALPSAIWPAVRP